EPRIAASDYFAHAGEIVVADDGFDDELAIVALLHAAVFPDDHAGYLVGALNVRDVEALDAGRCGGGGEGVPQTPLGGDWRRVCGGGSERGSCAWRWCGPSPSWPSSARAGGCGFRPDDRVFPTAVLPSPRGLRIPPGRGFRRGCAVGRCRFAGAGTRKTPR